jgi:signal transduction histidine kinase/CheY-like chemotaxis protein/HPt (histidine-containing phosphotransfer) domain-containing protein
MSARTAPEPPGVNQLVEALERRLNAERAARKQAQAMLALREAGTAGAPAALAERLEQLIEERTQALSLARDEAVAASLAKSSFLANMSHEIRTPLTSIIGFAELLLQPQSTQVDADDALKTIIRNGRHLLQVINDILDLSKIETEQLEVESIVVPLPRLLSDIEALTAGRAQQKALLFTIEHKLPLPPALRTDPVRLKQILLNFSSNAIKFSNEGEVRLVVSHDAQTERIKFEVCDQGIGMSPEQVARLFQPFVQADVSTTRQFGGTGLGLYICQQLADLLGGEISVTSHMGRGSRFGFSLPVGMDTPAGQMLDVVEDFDAFPRPDFQITQVDVPELSGQVLLAEDGLDNQRLLASYLRQAGLQVDIVGNGELAVEAALRTPYELVLMDIQMPLMDGITATRKLREQGYRGPIVALTANVMQSDVLRYRQGGCDDVLAKPVDRDRFYSVLRRHVAAAQRPDTAAEADFAREMATLTEEFRAGLPATLQAIAAAAQADDWPALKLLVHTLKGTAGSYGFAGITQLAAEVEAQLEAGRPREAAELCPRLVRQAKHLAGLTVTA